MIRSGSLPLQRDDHRDPAIELAPAGMKVGKT